MKSMKYSSLITVALSLALTVVLTLATAIVPTAVASASQVGEVLSIDREELADELLEVFKKTLSEEEFQSFEVNINLKPKHSKDLASLQTIANEKPASLRTMTCSCSPGYTTRASDPCSRFGKCWTCQ